jgi:hypothetical protein
MMLILELFSGTECISDAFRSRGHRCYTVDWDRQFPSSLHIDITKLTADMILCGFGRPDVIWAGCDCTTFSVASIGFHRMQDPATGVLLPKTEAAAKADEVNRHTLQLIRDLTPRLWFIENPMGGLRKMDYMQGLPRHLITYCQYGFPSRKATDIWTNHPDPQFPPPLPQRRPLSHARPARHEAGPAGHPQPRHALCLPGGPVRAHRGHQRDLHPGPHAAAPLALQGRWRADVPVLVES